MCLAIPGKLVEIAEEDGLKTGRIDYSGTVGKACLEYVPEAQLGQYVLVHAGFAISVIDEEEAKKTLELWNELVESGALDGPDGTGAPSDRRKGNRDK